MGHSGYVAEGVMYLLIGGFALIAALNPSQRPNGSKGALAKLAVAPYGEALLALLAAGLAAFVAWQTVLAILDPEHRRERRTLKRRALRLGYLCNGGLHAVFVVEAVWPLVGMGASADHGRAQAVWAGRVMSLVPLGRWLIAATGAGIALYGFYEFYRGASHRKVERIDLTHTKLRGIILLLGWCGFLTRGVLFIMIGVFLIDAAHHNDTRHATGVAGALASLRSLPWGSWLLGVIAAGLMCYGLFQIIKEPFRDFHRS
jgi:hypothetical protein